MAHDTSLPRAFICHRDLVATSDRAPTTRLARDEVAVATGGFDSGRIGGVAAWLGAGAQRLARRVVYQLNSRSVLCFFWRDS
ncbi:hypothetical protein [Roseovarius sp. EL26]|jgi:hypothetical protein|uniref:hypothetical protein n=1 Tax=Roseovarius sp. EL26 TaxID=2126672 RepID=UPI000EA0D230|nr:hypothetical protein [Roseovarius sp. EL26]